MIRGITSLRKQYMFAAVVLATLPLLALSLFVSSRVGRLVRSDSDEYTQSTVRHLSLSVEDTINERRIEALTIAKYPPISGIFRARDNGGIDPVDNSTREQWFNRLAKLFVDFAAMHPRTVQVRLLDAKGYEVLRVNHDGVNRPVVVPEEELQFKGNRDYFQAIGSLAEGECYVSPISVNVEHGKADGTSVVRVGTPLWWDNKFAGAIVVNLNPTNIIRHVEQYSADGQIVIATEDGALMYRASDEHQWGVSDVANESLFDVLPDLAVAPRSAAKDSGIAAIETATSTDGQKHLTYSVIDMGRGSPRWIVGLERDMDAVLADSRSIEVMVLAATGVIALIAMLVALWASGYWSRPIVDLAYAAEAVSKGDMSVRVRENRADEIGMLARTFNRMVTRIRGMVKLEAEKAVAERANRAKSEFLANMSHEIRTPMTAIIGFAELLDDPNLSDSERREHVHVVRRNGRHLLHIVNDVLDISKIEAGKMSVERTRCDPGQIIREVISLMRLRAESKGLTLEARFLKPLPTWIESDATRLRQIVLNVVGNAIKFTDEGGVTVEATLEDGQGGEDLLRIDVVDTGIGFHASQETAIFETFSQGDNSATRAHGGTGLGLTISRGLAELLGGGLRAQSRPGTGSRFIITVGVGIRRGELAEVTSESGLPDEQQTATSGSDEAVITRGRVLLAEDGADNQRLISLLLKKSGFDVHVVTNGKQAVETAMAASPPFDIVLMDMQMPVMDGYTASTELRSLGYAGRIVALTAHALPEDRAKCVDAGCDDYLTKPVSRETLIAACVRSITDRSPGEADAATSKEAADASSTDDRDPEAPRILISELADDPDVGPLIDKFVAGLSDRIGDLVQFVGDEDFDALASLAHQLKGSAGGYGFPSITQAARECETLARAGTDIGAMCDAVDSLIHECNAAIAGRRETAQDKVDAA